MCCRIDRCCFCFEHSLGVKIMGILSIPLQLAIIIYSTLELPQFLFAIAPTFSIGIFCDIFLIVAVFRESRWFLLPWLIYIMILIVGLGLAAVLWIVIPLGAISHPDWIKVVLVSIGCLAVAGVLLYFWIVVLELFIRLGPFQEYGAGMYPPQQMAPQMAPAAAYAYAMYGSPPPPPPQPIYGGHHAHHHPGPPSLIYQQPPPPQMYMA